MLKWAGEQGLTDLPTTRFFGFNNPEPAYGRPEHGYEVWINVPEGTEAPAPVQIKRSAGGLYAVTSTYVYEIEERWQALWHYINESKEYAWERGGRWLEETTSPGKSATPHDHLQLDLFLPIRRL
ncbi:MAG TPA: GyrI-like domain-containing protein [Symbiobacteriaceae bacterium]|nr:GyrI-like domain-containing protein [Symbiobacteriaceae bacterium]